MKKLLLVSSLLTSLVLGSAPALAAAAPSQFSPPPTKAERQLKIKLLQIQRKQKVTSVKIKKNISQVKRKITAVKKGRAAEKKRRATIKRQAAKKRTAK